MDNYQILTKKLIDQNNGSFITDLIIEPTEEQRIALIEGSGNPEGEMRQVNSSAGLAFNYWGAYGSCHKDSDVEFEWKKRVPLKKGIPANIDVVVRDNERIRFIESKFLEPYYSGNEIPRKSYLDTSKYSSITQDSPESWVELFKKAQEYEFYNITQLCRHLLAIAKDMWIAFRQYQNKQVELLSVTWDMPDPFISLFSEKDANEFKKRRARIREEAKKSETLINSFIKDHLGFGDLKYEAITYNIIIGDISDKKYLDRLKKQYFLD